MGREMACCAGVDHAHNSTIFWWGYVGGVPYIAMGGLEGDTLEAWVPESASLPDKAATVAILERMSGIAVALDSGHELGVIHRHIDFFLGHCQNAVVVRAGIIMSTATHGPFRRRSVCRVLNGAYT